MHVFPNDKIYIGITSMLPEQRWGKDGYGYKGQKILYSAIKKYGWSNIQHIIIANGVSYESAKNIEIDLIALYDITNRKNGYNISPGGDLISEESRKKISNSRIGQHPSEEARKKMSDARKGKKKSEEHRRKIGEAHRGMKRSEETRRKISEKAKGRKRSIDNDPRSIPILQYRLDTEEFVARYKSAASAGRELNVSYPHIHECAQDKRRQVANCVWIYEKDATEEYVKYRINKAKIHGRFSPIVLSNDKYFIRPIYCESISIAARFINGSDSSIQSAADSNRSYHGYYFKRITPKEYLQAIKE